ncbi:endonuclease/exonuclease/phosphatase family metal-dependent hydrolase [Pseudarthrobacter defluvii]|uniref:endonuclease/exonuclease/phosphatase family protein n=1 Tax=Pseudarthrobacter defluvii TaxID=410837 RepID=UPI002782064D|nr:endonuclease/exonuclease/phosphatase family protein [Pseudarthrobacter defluvii]MDQ0768845.1 endonuclease/exonuclease/phosphatase family metal-dependent hydrolase [Pseudarthrobacter defluvii]
MTASGRPAGRRRAAAVCRWLFVPVALPVAAVSVLRALPAELPVLGVQLVAFTPWLAVPAAAALLVSFLGRRRWQQVAAAALLACQVFWLFPIDIREPAAEAAGGRVSLVAMSINAELGGADAAGIVGLVREGNVDLLAVEEYTPQLARRLTVAGLDGLLPHRVAHPRDGAGGSAIYSSYNLKETGVLPGTQFTMPVARLDLGAASLKVVAVHTLAPAGSGLDQWRSDLATVAGADNGSGPMLLAGDFNATYDHREYRAVLAGQGGQRSLVDVAASLGSRLVPTWPMRGYRLPGIALDHLVTSPDIKASGYSVHRVDGTDHAAVVATLHLQVP